MAGETPWLSLTHQDDDVIGSGGTMKGLAEGVLYKPDNVNEDDWHMTLIEGQGFKWPYTKSQFASVQNALAMSRSGKILLNPLYEEPSNVVVVYVTNGAKFPETVKTDLHAAHPTLTQAEILDYYSRLLGETHNLETLTKFFNQSRYHEALAALDIVGASAAVFLEFDENVDIRSGRSAVAAAVNIAELIRQLQPAVVYTLSPFEIKHDVHIHTSDITVAALRAALPFLGSKPLLRGYPVWNPFMVSETVTQLEVVDTSQFFAYKTDAIHAHSLHGSQGTFGFKRSYEEVMSTNGVNGAFVSSEMLMALAQLDSFRAFYTRPRLPFGIQSAETFVPMDDLLEDSGRTLRGFVEDYFKLVAAKYPASIIQGVPVLPGRIPVK
ncbi:MAG TPA: PIG-L family deacetylase [Candidatus Nanoarchaeia archaeon]|nr:PIG-L family deacetylase [Candidatus Nanoarchaeia archaeon]